MRQMGALNTADIESLPAQKQRPQPGGAGVLVELSDRTDEDKGRGTGEVRGRVAPYEENASPEV
jgi:hypothetical protein